MKKRVLFAINHFRHSNGVAIALRSIILNLDRNKYDIYLLAFYEFDSDFAKPVIDKITLIPGFGFYFRGFDKLVHLMPSKYLYKRFIKMKFDLEVSFQFGVPTRVLSISNNPHRLCWMHTYDTHMHQGKYYKKYPKMITVSKIGREKLLKEGFSLSNTDYCYNIIDEDFILNKASEKLDYEKKHRYVVVTVARMMPDKAYYRYVECIKEIVKDKTVDAEFWLVGGGSEQSRVERFVQDNGLADYIKVFGKQNNPYKFISSSDLYFCGSYREGFSTACQEAALLGIPVISVKVDGAEELINQADCGRVIDNDAKSICIELKNILTDEHLVSEWKEKAVSNKTSFYKKERIEKIDHILQEALLNE